MFGAMLSRPQRKAIHVLDHCKPMSFAEAFYWFKYFFHKKTGVCWDQRLEGVKMGEEYFVYTPPVLGRPVGYVAEGYVRPELRIREISEESGEGETTEAESDVTAEGGEVVYDTDSEVEDDGEDSEDSSTAPTMITVSDSRGGSEDENATPRSITERDEDGDAFGGSVVSVFDRNVSTSFGGSFGGSFGPFASSRRSEDSGETEPTLTLTQVSKESDGLRGVLEDVVRAKTPPGLIYLSD
jgi:hypothetical protein